MKQKLKKQDSGFTQVSNKILNDKSLSWKAKGIWSYLYSKPEDWDFSGKRICKDSIDGKSATYSGIKELEQRGYIKRKKEQSGRVIYYICFSQFPETAITENRNYRKPQLPKTGTISNKDINKYSLINNKEVRGKSPKTPKPTINVFDDFLKEKEKIVTLLGERGASKEWSAGEIEKFLNYWQEKNINTGKERWQLEKTFEPKRRFSTWIQRSAQYQRKNTSLNNKYKPAKI